MIGDRDKALEFKSKTSDDLPLRVNYSFDSTIDQRETLVCRAREPFQAWRVP